MSVYAETFQSSTTGMKIALLTNLYPPFVRGGAEYLAHEMVLELRRQGHQVTVITTVPWKSVKSFRPKLHEEGGVQVYRFFPLNLYHYLYAARVPYPVRFLWQLWNLWNVPAARVVERLLRSTQPDLVISSNLMGLSFLIPRAVKRLGLTQIHILHDVQLLHPSGLFLWGKDKLSLPMRLYQQCTKRLFAPVAVAVSPSEWLLERHSARGFFAHSKTAVLPNPVPLAQNQPHTKTTNKPLKLLYDGQLEVHKGVFWLIEALKTLPRQDFELHLVARGDKARLQQTRALMGNDSRFKLHWLVTQAEIDEHYTSAHLTIVPSLCYENSPGSIAKSFLAGTPVLAVRVGGIPELIREGETGWLYTPADRQEFVQKLTWCLDNPGDLLRAGLKGSRAFADRTLEGYVKKLVALA